MGSWRTPELVFCEVIRPTGAAIRKTALDTVSTGAKRYRGLPFLLEIVIAKHIEVGFTRLHAEQSVMTVCEIAIDASFIFFGLRHIIMSI